MNQVFRQLGPHYREIIGRLMAEPLAPLENLWDEVDRYAEELTECLSSSEFLDIYTACELAEECRDLIREVTEDYSPARHRVLQVAVRYFVLDDDVESDANSIIGFDDDAEVVRIAKEYLSTK